MKKSHDRYWEFRVVEPDNRYAFGAGSEAAAKCRLISQVGHLLCSLRDMEDNVSMGGTWSA